MNIKYFKRKKKELPPKEGFIRGYLKGIGVPVRIPRVLYNMTMAFDENRLNVFPVADNTEYSEKYRRNHVAGYTLGWMTLSIASLIDLTIAGITGNEPIIYKINNYLNQHPTTIYYANAPSAAYLVMTAVYNSAKQTKNGLEKIIEKRKKRNDKTII